MSFSSPSPRQASIELVFIAGLWGFGFVATQWALETWSPLGVLLWRFSIAFALGEFVHFVFRWVRSKVQAVQTSPRHWSDRDFFLAIPAGILLGTFILLQTIGLQFTSASKSGFITTLYVLFVPFLNALFFKKRASKAVIALGLLACFGMYLLMDISLETFAEDVNVGDLWTLAAAVLAAVHIIFIGRIVHKVEDAFRLNNYQSLWAMMTISPTVFITAQLQHGPILTKSFVGLAILAAACSVLAFFVQVRSQKVLSDTTASMLFLLESPYAFFFAYFLMGDRLNFSQSAGALIILGAAALTVVLETTSSQTNRKPQV